MDDPNAPTPLASYLSTVPNFCFADRNFTPTGTTGRLDLFVQEEVDEFDAALAELQERSPAIRNMVKKMSLDAAEQFARDYLANMTPQAKQGAVDSASVKQVEVAAAAQQTLTPQGSVVGEESSAQSSIVGEEASQSTVSTSAPAANLSSMLAGLGK